MFKIAAEALGGSAWDLERMAEPERSFWLYRGLLWNSSVSEALTEDGLDRDLARGTI